VQCIKCKEWAHLLCTKGRLHYKWPIVFRLKLKVNLKFQIQTINWHTFSYEQIEVCIISWLIIIPAFIIMRHKQGTVTWLEFSVIISQIFEE
jgi:hypothetical protein